MNYQDWNRFGTGSLGNLGLVEIGAQLPGGVGQGCHGAQQHAHELGEQEHNQLMPRGVVFTTNPNKSSPSRIPYPMDKM
jgi:hypothetical protein